MIHILDFIAYYYHHRIKFQINILVWRKPLLFPRNAWCCSCHFLLVTIVNFFFLLLLERQNYSKYLTLVLKSVRQGWNSFPQSLAMKIFCGKESKSISKIHPHEASHPQNPHHSGHYLSNAANSRLVWKNEVPKWKAQNV